MNNYPQITMRQTLVRRSANQARETLQSSPCQSYDTIPNRSAVIHGGTGRVPMDIEHDASILGDLNNPKQLSVEPGAVQSIQQVWYAAVDL